MSQLTKNKSTYHHGNLKESLVSTAYDMVDKKGIKALTLRELTMRLGTSRSAVYRHFDNKEALISAVVKKGHEQLDLVLSPIFQDKTQSIAKRFEMMGKVYLNIAAEHPNLYRLLFIERYPQRQETTKYKDTKHVMGLRFLMALLIEAQEKGVIARGNLMIQLTTVWASMHGFATFLINEHSLINNNQEAIYEYLQDVLLKGLKG
ncbi:MAG: TetR/AcrR family transcriptional regulator [Sulfuricurvum sp.]|nr:TetR/AcrR family transcriptional regulator [Sulfuricurvum sp.]